MSNNQVSGHCNEGWQLWLRRRSSRFGAALRGRPPGAGGLRADVLILGKVPCLLLYYTFRTAGSSHLSSLLRRRPRGPSARFRLIGA